MIMDGAIGSGLVLALRSDSVTGPIAGGPGPLLRWALAGAFLIVGALDRVGAAKAAEPSRDVERGVVYQHDVIPEVPWSVHIVKVDRRSRELFLTPSLGNGHRIGKATVSDQVRLLPDSLGRPVAAINGDLYLDDTALMGDPRDLLVMRGELVSAPAGHACFWIDPKGQPQQTNVDSRLRVILPGRRRLMAGLNEIGFHDEAVLYTSAVGALTPATPGAQYVLERVRGDWVPLRVGRRLEARVREVRAGGSQPVGRDDLVLTLGDGLGLRLAVGDRIQVVPQTHPDLSGVQTAIGGGPTLVRNGQAMRWSSFPRRHPRSAIGWNDRWIFLVEVDGRQGGLSVGMTFPELADYLVRLGCREAVNLDGGGSSTLWLLGRVMNSPSDGRERPVANALVVVQRPSSPAGGDAPKSSRTQGRPTAR